MTPNKPLSKPQIGEYSYNHFKTTEEPLALINSLISRVLNPKDEKCKDLFDTQKKAVEKVEEEHDISKKAIVEECRDKCKYIKQEIEGKSDIYSVLNSLGCKEKFMQFGKRSITIIDNLSDLETAFEGKKISNLFFAKTGNRGELVIHNRVDMMGTTVNNEEKITYKIRLPEGELEKFLSTKEGGEKVNNTVTELEIDDSIYDEDLAEIEKLGLEEDFDVEANNKLLKTKILDNFPKEARSFIKVSFEHKDFDLSKMKEISDFNSFKKGFGLDGIKTQRELLGIGTPVLYPVQDLDDDGMLKIIVVQSVPITVQFGAIVGYNDFPIGYIDPSKLEKNFGKDAELWFEGLEKANI